MKTKEEQLKVIERLELNKDVYVAGASDPSKYTAKTNTNPELFGVGGQEEEKELIDCIMVTDSDGVERLVELPYLMTETQAKRWLKGGDNERK